MPFWRARTPSVLTVAPRASLTSNSPGLRSISPASIFEKSRMSLITVRRCSADDVAISRYSRCSGFSSESSTSAVMPRTPFIGVRISWLMLARNSLFARLAASATSFAFCNSASARRRWMTSPVSSFVRSSTRSASSRPRACRCRTRTRWPARRRPPQVSASAE